MVLSSVTPRSLPSWLNPTTLGIAGLVIVGLVAIFSPNFGAAAIAAGIASFVIAAGMLVLLAVDKSLRLQWAVIALVLAAVGAAALLGNGAAYAFAVSRAEAQGNYGAAVADLKAMGKAPPYSTDLAQAYLDWANNEVQNKVFDQAIAHYNYVAQNFPTLPQAATAQAALPGTYLGWAQYATSQGDAVMAGQEYQTLLTQYAASPEALHAHSLAPAAYVAWGDAEFKVADYEQAYVAYSLVTKGFPKDAEAQAAHAKAAQVLLAWAKALTAAHRYSEASTHYTDLAKNYADTAQGQAAINLLNQGVQVIGRLFKADGKTPAMPFTTVRLSSQWSVANGSPLSYNVSGQQYYADTDANGYFVFPSVPSGQYLLEWRSTGGAFLTIFNGTTPLEIITVRPLDSSPLPPIITSQK